jgi:hypothetical protein
MPAAEHWPDTGLVREGLRLMRDLPQSATDQVLLTPDLHAGNVLRAHREPWLAIDPKPLVAEPAYDATQHLLNCKARLRSDPDATIRCFAEPARRRPRARPYVRRLRDCGRTPRSLERRLVDRARPSDRALEIDRVKPLIQATMLKIFGGRCAFRSKRCAHSEDGPALSPRPNYALKGRHSGSLRRHRYLSSFTRVSATMYPT